MYTNIIITDDLVMILVIVNTIISVINIGDINTTHHCNCYYRYYYYYYYHFKICDALRNNHTYLEALSVHYF